jgi:hypothetical protein
MPNVDFTRLAVALTTLIATVDLAGAQQSAGPEAPWAGWARCQINVSSPGYSDQQTHTWMITGGAPAVEGAFRVYQGTWSVVGGGSLQRTQGGQTLKAQWATNGPDRERFEHASRERERGPHAAGRLASDRIVYVAVQSRCCIGAAAGVDGATHTHATFRPEVDGRSTTEPQGPLTPIRFLPAKLCGSRRSSVTISTPRAWR